MFVGLGVGVDVGFGVDVGTGVEVAAATGADVGTAVGVAVGCVCACAESELVSPELLSSGTLLRVSCPVCSVGFATVLFLASFDPELFVVLPEFCSLAFEETEVGSGALP